MMVVDQVRKDCATKNKVSKFIPSNGKYLCVCGGGGG